jgi:hypothetical protein
MHCKQDPIYVFQEMKLCGLFSNFHIHIFVSDLYILILQEPFKDSATSPTARILTCDTALSTAFFYYIQLSATTQRTN